MIVDLAGQEEIGFDLKVDKTNGLSFVVICTADDERQLFNLDEIVNSNAYGENIEIAR